VSPIASIYHHTLSECDRELHNDSRYDPFHCRPDWFTCSCGRKFVHICDEAEGCFYITVEDYKQAIRRANDTH
jgi:hypothetical protein